MEKIQGYKNIWEGCCILSPKLYSPEVTTVNILAYILLDHFFSKHTHTHSFLKLNGIL